MLVFFMIKSPNFDMEYPQGIFSPILVVEDFSGLLAHPSIFLIKNSMSS